jgi:hypothetical protein
MYNIIIGADDLGIITSEIVSKENDQPLKIYGWGVENKAFNYVESNHVTRGIFDNAYIEQMIFPVQTILESNGNLKPTGKNSAKFDKEHLLFDLGTPLNISKVNTISNMYNKFDKNRILADVLSVLIDKVRDRIEIIYDESGNIKKDVFQFDDNSNLFINIPINKAHVVGSQMCLIFSPEKDLDKPNKNKKYNHLYQFTVSADKNKAGEYNSFFNPYATVIDEYFRKGLVLKNITPTYGNTTLNFKFDFESKDVLYSFDIINIGAEIIGLPFICGMNPTVKQFKKMGVRFIKQNKKLVKLKSSLRSDFNTTLVGSNVMQDNSSLSDNIFEIYHENLFLNNRNKA